MELNDMTSTSKPKVALSLIRATGRIRLGNYLGAVRSFVTLGAREDVSCIFGVETLHSLTTQSDREGLRSDIRGVVLGFLAAGGDPGRSVVFDQIAIPETLQLSWIVSCLATAVRLERMHHWEEERDRLADLAQAVNMGLFNYRVLMAADPLGPRAKIVPVGAEQVQYVEVTRELASCFNHQFGDYFKTLEALEREAIRALSLSASGKMAKLEGDKTTLYFSDSHDHQWNKVKFAPTGLARVRLKDPGNPKKCNIGWIDRILNQFGLHKEGTPEWVNEGCTQANMGYFPRKKKLLDVMRERFFGEIREYLESFVTRGYQYIDEMIATGNERAQARIKPVVEGTMDPVGLITQWR